MLASPCCRPTTSPSIVRPGGGGGAALVAGTGDRCSAAVGMVKGLLGATLFFLLANPPPTGLCGRRRGRGGYELADLPHVKPAGARWRLGERPHPGVKCDPLLRHDGPLEARVVRHPSGSRCVCGADGLGRPIAQCAPAVVFDTLARPDRHHFWADSLVYARTVTDVDDKITHQPPRRRRYSVPPSGSRTHLRHAALGGDRPRPRAHATVRSDRWCHDGALWRGAAYAAERLCLFRCPVAPDIAPQRRDRDAIIVGLGSRWRRTARPGRLRLWNPSD